VIIVDGVEDPHNLGSIIRVAECAGVHGIIIPRHRAVSVNETVIKVSAGESVCAGGDMRVYELSGEYELSLDGHRRQSPLVLWSELGEPFFSGTAEYEKTCEIAKADGASYTLDIGKVYNCAEVYLNGAHVTDLLWDFKCDVSTRIKDGKNRLLLKVANSYANQLYRMDFKSGLLGPVRIIERYRPRSETSGRLKK
jgi:hypothetical protein